MHLLLLATKVRHSCNVAARSRIPLFSDFSVFDFEVQGLSQLYAPRAVGHKGAPQLQRCREVQDCIPEEFHALVAGRLRPGAVRECLLQQQPARGAKAVPHNGAHLHTDTARGSLGD